MSLRRLLTNLKIDGFAVVAPRPSWFRNSLNSRSPETLWLTGSPSSIDPTRLYSHILRQFEHLEIVREKFMVTNALAYLHRSLSVRRYGAQLMEIPAKYNTFPTKRHVDLLAQIP